MQKQHTIKPEQDSKVEKTTLTAALEQKKKKKQNKHRICIIHVQLNTMGKNITVIKTTMGVLAKDQVIIKRLRLQFVRFDIPRLNVFFSVFCKYCSLYALLFCSLHFVILFSQFVIIFLNLLSCCLHGEMKIAIRNHPRSSSSS